MISIRLGTAESESRRSVGCVRGSKGGRRRQTGGCEAVSTPGRPSRRAATAGTWVGRRHLRNAVAAAQRAASPRTLEISVSRPVERAAREERERSFIGAASSRRRAENPCWLPVMSHGPRPIVTAARRRLPQALSSLPSAAAYPTADIEDADKRQHRPLNPPIPPYRVSFRPAPPFHSSRCRGSESSR